jgi:hypothetical protein
MQATKSTSPLPATTTQPEAVSGAGGTSVPGAQTAPGAPALPVPSTSAEVRALYAKRGDLTSQLRTYEARAEGLIENLRSAPTEAKAGLTERLNIVNQNIFRVESELAATRLQISSAPPGLGSSQSQSPPFRPNDMRSEITVISVVAIIFVLAPIALAFARVLWRRATRRAEAPRDIEDAQRLKRMEHAVDAMAIEVERISEGQRFLTQLFAREPRAAELTAASAYESPDPARAQRDAEPIPAEPRRT